MKKKVVIITSIILIGVIIFLVFGYFDKKSEKENFSQIKDMQSSLNENYTYQENQNSPSKDKQETLSNKWEDKGIAISGKYADAEIFNFGNKYRIYYSEEPEVADFKGRIFSSVSSNGINWQDESGTRKEWATFISIIKTDDNKYRMYFQNAGVIKSALSSNGINWQDESGTRIDKSNNVGLDLENVASPTVMKIGSEYIIIYRGDIKEKYSGEVPNNNIQILLWATSKDGLTFEKKGIALDSRNNELQGLADGPEFADFNGETRIYFWSYQGVYHLTFKENKFSAEEFDLSVNTDTNKKFSPNPPSDPTIIQINGEWFMYYGQHTKGIYYATLNKEN